MIDLSICKHKRKKGGALLSGVKYILRTELIFERVTSQLTPIRATDEEYNAWQEIELLYEISQVRSWFIHPLLE